MISRRALLGTGAATAAVAAGIGAAGLAHRLDDLARKAGIEPHPEPDPADELLLAEARTSQTLLLATVEATAAKHAKLRLDPFVAIGREHLTAVGGPTGPRTPPRISADAAKAVKTLAKSYARASKARSTDAVAAVSPDLARVLASMSAGLAQCARTVGESP